jgi:Zn-dependent protease with chaperone function
MKEEINRNNIEIQAKKVLCLSLLFIAYYLLLILLGVAMFGVTLWLTIELILHYYVLLASIQVGIFIVLLMVGLWVMCYKVGWFLIKPLFVFPDTSDDNREEIRKEDAPKLFSMINEIATATGNKMPKHVYLIPEANAYVFYESVSIWSIFFPSEKNLAIGVGLLKGLNLSELKAILSHEYGHFSQDSMREGTITYRLLIIIREMVKFSQEEVANNLVAQSKDDYKSYLHFAVHPISWITKMTTNFYNYIEKSKRSLSRFMEFEADTVACKMAGSSAHISALYKSAELDNSFNFYKQFLFQLMQEGHWCKDFFKGYSQIFDRCSQEAEVSSVH